MDPAEAKEALTHLRRQERDRTPMMRVAKKVKATKKAMAAKAARRARRKNR